MSKEANKNTIAPKIAYAVGDGIGPEIMRAVLDILEKAGARLDLHPVIVGMAAYEAGEIKGISEADFKTLESCQAFLKAPLSTPQGKGYSSVNVAIRKHFDLFANIRPSVSLSPVIPTKNNAEGVDVVLVRENLEDLYAGIEHRPTPDVAIGRKVSTKSESERISRAAFEYARANGRGTVTGIAKDNIQKMTDGTNFHDVFDAVARDYGDIKSEFYIADIGIARLGARPQDFDVVVTQNMYGDIGSDVIAEALGSVGLSGSANLGNDFAMFEAVHGTAPDIAGKGIANPSGLLMASVMMLNYLGQHDVAERVHNAWLRTLEQGYHTGDIYSSDYSFEKVGTKGFAYAITENLGEKPRTLKPADYTNNKPFDLPKAAFKAQPFKFQTIGADVHVYYDGSVSNLAGDVKAALCYYDMSLQEIKTARGDSVWPEQRPFFGTDYFTLRLMFDNAAKGNEQNKQMSITAALNSLAREGINWREVNTLTQTMDNPPKPNFR